MQSRLIVVGVAVLVAAAALPACGKKSSPPASDTNSAEPSPSGATNWVCPMDPDVTSDKAGRCSKCGMELIPQK